MEKIRVHLLIHGRVQGVWYRRHAEQKAKELNLGGWTHNLVDGSVEIVAEGEKERIEQFIAWTKEGSPLAKVEYVEVSYEPYTGEFKDFSVREFGF